MDEALATVRMLEEKRLQLLHWPRQVSNYNLAKYGLDSLKRHSSSVRTCQAGSRILAECYKRSGR
ncbi:type VI secretion protein, partial [Stenotrophomonas rhizophila]